MESTTSISATGAKQSETAHAGTSHEHPPVLDAITPRSPWIVTSDSNRITSATATATGSQEPFQGLDNALIAAAHSTALLAQFPEVKCLPFMSLRRETTGAKSATGKKHRGQCPSKSNSERGKAFRAKQREREVDIMKALTSLQSEIYDLQVVRNTRRQCVLQTRQAYSGSLLKLVREYYGLFYIGVPDLLVGERRLGTNGYQDLITRQRLYLEHAFDPDFRLGSQPGSVALVLEQWKRYTQYHNDLSARANEFEICGSDEQPIIIARGTVRVRYTHRTFEHVFPHALYDASLVQRFIGKEVVYTYRNVYEFSDDGRIISYEPEIDFVQPLLDAGSSLEDVSRLMQQARIADQCIFFGPDDENESEAAVSMIDEILEDGNISDRTSDSTHSSPAEKMPRTSSKHDMNFLLSQNGGGDDGNSNG